MADPVAPPPPASFDALAASRRDWINCVLRPWCVAAPRKELLKAEQDWGDIAGRVDPAMTLWLWAWSRFPPLYTEGLNGLEESYEVDVCLKSGERHTGYPNARESERGLLVLNAPGGPTRPLSIDDIAAIRRL